MFTVPDAPSYRAPLKEWCDYLLLLETRHASAKGVAGAIAEARGVIEALTEKKGWCFVKKSSKFRPPKLVKRVYKKIYRIETHLQSYLAFIEYWDAGAGDTHDLLGAREILRDRHSELSIDDALKMKSADDRVLALNIANGGKAGWNVKMLSETSVLIEKERDKNP